MKNQGSAVVEMSLILPIVFGVLVLVLTLFLDTVRDSLVQQEGHTLLYTYDGKNLRDTQQEKPSMQGNQNFGADVREDGIEILSDHEYRYEKEGHIFITETGVCSSRLRRWQLYGDIIWE